MTKIEDRLYVLRTRRGHRGELGWLYYRKGGPNTTRLCEAELFTLQKAKNQKQFAQGSSLAPSCEVKRVSRKELFVATLEGK